MLAAVMLMTADAQSWSQETRRFFGEGAASCVEWTRERQVNKGLGTEMMAWIRGYLSGANAYYASADVLKQTGVSVDASYALIDGYCRTHPLENLVVAADALTNELRSRVGRK
jgi:hypothetical protein